MRQARATFTAAVEPGATVITVENVGRPAENIEYYTGSAHALYATELDRWHITLRDAANVITNAGQPLYLLLPPSEALLRDLHARLEPTFTVELVVAIEPEAAIDYFVASRLNRGSPMALYRLRRTGE